MSYMNDTEHEAREFVDAMDELRRDFGERFVEDRLILTSRCSMSQDTIGESNERSLERDSGLPVQTGWRPYVYEAWVDVDDVTDVETAELIHDILTALRDYPVYDDADYSELENERLNEYMRDDLPSDLANDVGLTPWESEHVAEWLANVPAEELWEYNDGSVDDMPINTRKMAKDHGRAIVATVAGLMLVELFADSLT